MNETTTMLFSAVPTLCNLYLPQNVAFMTGANNAQQLFTKHCRTHEETPSGIAHYSGLSA